MIRNPDRSQLAGLIEKEQDDCLSIVMPTEVRGRETNQNAIRFKNLLRTAREKVDAEGASRSGLREQLDQLRSLEHDTEFWQHQGQGLAIFCSAAFQARVQVDHRVDEAVYVGDHFYLRPLAAQACGRGTARGLALSWTGARLFQISPDGADECDDDSFPVMIRDLVTPRDPEEQLQLFSHRASGQQAGASDVAMFHGQGEGEQKLEADRRNYLSRVGDLVGQGIYNLEQPLVVVATAEVAGEFQSVAAVEVADVIEVSPDGVDDAELRTRLERWLGEYQRRDENKLLERLGTALASGQASEILNDVVLAAADGKVDTLILRGDEPLWGSLDRSQRSVQVARGGADASVDLINVAVHDTLAAGGQVCCHHPGTPGPEVAAIFRY